MFKQQCLYSEASCLTFAEFTTMAGRRLRDAVKNTLIQNSVTQDFSKSHIVIAGLTNDYSQYVTTFEEYQIQRYEVEPHTPCGSADFCRISLRL